MAEPGSVRFLELHTPILYHLAYCGEFDPEFLIYVTRMNLIVSGIIVDGVQFPFAAFCSFKTESFFHQNEQMLAWPTSLK